MHAKPVAWNLLMGYCMRVSATLKLAHELVCSCKRDASRAYLWVKQLLSPAWPGFVDLLVSTLVSPVTLLKTLLAFCIGCCRYSSRRSNLRAETGSERSGPDGSWQDIEP